MIAKVHIKNFRCIRDALLELGRFTVLVGPNGSGKSTILDALDSSHARGVATWRRQPGAATVTTTSETGDAFTWNSRSSSKSPYQSQILLLQPGQLRKENTVERAERLATDGSNLANVFASLTRKEQGELAQTLSSLVPVIGDVDVEPIRKGAINLRFRDRWDKSVWYQPSEVSDGTMLMTAFLVLQYQPAPVDLVAIEDAEHALHPYLIGELIKLLRSLALGALGPRSIQVVCTTHSADFLDHLEPTEVRFISRDARDGAVVINSIDAATPHWEHAYAEYKHSLSDVWLSGGAGGV